MIRYSTADFPRRHRREMMCELIGREFWRMEVEELPDRRFHAEATIRVLPGLYLQVTRAIGMQLRRTPALIDSDDLVLEVSLGRGHLVSQRGREVSISSGSAVLRTAGEPSVVAFPHDEHMVAFRMPLHLIAPLVGNMDSVLARPIPNDAEALRLLVNYADMIDRMPGLEKPEVRHVVATHIHDLIALTLGATRDAAELARNRGAPAARLNALKDDITRHLDRGDLSVIEVAARHRLTPRYVQMLFEGEGTTFTEFVRDQRLIRAHRMLCDPSLARRSISEIAFDAGFGDVSYFNRAFRRRFGDTPSGVRSQARRAASGAVPG